MSTLRPSGGNWVTGTLGGATVQAKVYSEPSQYGMEQEPRISKLWVAMSGTSTHAPGNVVLYDFDRGEIGKNHLNEAGLAKVIAAVIKAAR